MLNPGLSMYNVVEIIKQLYAKTSIKLLWGLEQVDIGFSPIPRI
jgi:hypothetical protein